MPHFAIYRFENKPMHEESKKAACFLDIQKSILYIFVIFG